MNDAPNHEDEGGKVTPEGDEPKTPETHEGDDALKDTPEEGDEPKGDAGKESPDDVRKRHKDHWLNKLKDGKVKYDEIPDSAAYLKKEPEFDEFKPKATSKPKEEDFYSAVDKVLDERDARQEFNSMIDHLQDLGLTAEKDAELQTKFEDQLSSYSKPTPNQTLKALETACELVGVKEVSESAKERRRKGMTLPPLTGGKKRDVSKNAKAKETEVEKRLGGNLPPGF